MLVLSYCQCIFLLCFVFMYYSRPCVHLAIMFLLLCNIYSEMIYKSGTQNWQIDGAWLSRWNWNRVLFSCTPVLTWSGPYITISSPGLSLHKEKQTNVECMKVFYNLCHIFIPFQKTQEFFIIFIGVSFTGIYFASMIVPQAHLL